jgi:hypothetical protein
VRRTLIWSVVMLALGVAGGLFWVWLAEPAQWEVTEQGIILTEDAARGQFEVVVAFVAIGAVLCLGWGVAAGRVLREIGWRLVPVFAVFASAAALIAWRVGVALGPADPRDTVDPSLGDRLPAQLEIDAVAPFVVWPIFALAGLLLAAWLDRSDDVEPSDEFMAGHA